MVSPKTTRADHEGTPCCPHCGASMLTATVSVENLMGHYPLGSKIETDDDGYSREGGHLTAHCGVCCKPVAIGFNSDPERWHDWQIKLVAARTKRDVEYLEQVKETS